MEKLLGHPYFFGLAMQRLAQKGGVLIFVLLVTDIPHLI